MNTFLLVSQLLVSLLKTPAEAAFEVPKHLVRKAVLLVTCLVLLVCAAVLALMAAMVWLWPYLTVLDVLLITAATLLVAAAITYHQGRALPGLTLPSAQHGGLPPSLGRLVDAFEKGWERG